MPAKSILNSRLNSGTSTPRKDRDEEEFTDSEFTSPLFSAQLQARLKQLDLSRSAAAGGENGAIPKHHNFSKNGLVHAIEVLSEDRRKTSELAREQALGTLLRHLVMKYDPAVVHFELFSTIVQAFTSARTEIEAVTALQLICVSLTMVEENEDGKAADCFDLVAQLQKSLLKRVEDTASVQIRQALVITFAILTYFLNAGGGGYGMETAVANLMEVAESTSGAENAPVAAAALNGASLLTTLTSQGSANEIAMDWLFSLVPMLEVPQLSARLAAVKFVAVLFEVTDPHALRYGDNEEACDEILATLESIAQESTAKTAKRDKKVQNLLVKSVLKTVQYCVSDEHTDAVTKAAAGDPEGEDTHVSELVSQYHKHTVSKNLGIHTWAALVVIEHLTWVFGPGIHNQLANNPYIKSLLEKEDVHVESSAPPEDEESKESSTAPHFHDTPAGRLDAAQRSKELRRLQLQKSEEQGRIAA